jgi:hypothetical protein
VTTHLLPRDIRELVVIAELLTASDLVPDLNANMQETGDAARLIHVVAALRLVVGELKDMEALLVRALGQRARDEGGEWQGETGAFDWQVHGGSTRKAWDHDAWKRDARSKVSATLQAERKLAAVVTTDGEMLEVGAILWEAMERIQAAHGSAEPKKTVLKPLGLDVADYCETYDGPFTIDIRPSVREDDTTTEDTTDA